MDEKRTRYAEERVLIGTIDRGHDLLERITAIVNDEGIEVGRVEVFGSVESLVITRHDQMTRFPTEDRISVGCDIISLAGPVSLFKRRALPRLHGLFVEPEGRLHGGLLALGTRTHACEAVITSYSGRKLTRDFDPETGLPLWKNAGL